MNNWTTKDIIILVCSLAAAASLAFLLNMSFGKRFVSPMDNSAVKHLYITISSPDIDLSGVVCENLAGDKE